MSKTRGEAIRTYNQLPYPKKPLYWHLWKRAFDLGAQFIKDQNPKSDESAEDLIKNRIKELYPNRMELTYLLELSDSSETSKKLKTVENKIKWLRTFLKHLGLTVKIEKI